mmetsp:Transcript_35867/g.94261  ORF Transcript_35867/g.94261 Transcript_35867/m.94261 type:complete len:276 (-) Transcript_35867:77-904(-)
MRAVRRPGWRSSAFLGHSLPRPLAASCRLGLAKGQRREARVPPRSRRPLCQFGLKRQPAWGARRRCARMRRRRSRAQTRTRTRMRTRTRCSLDSRARTRPRAPRRVHRYRQRPTNLSAARMTAQTMRARTKLQRWRGYAETAVDHYPRRAIPQRTSTRATSSWTCSSSSVPPAALVRTASRGSRWASSATRTWASRAQSMCSWRRRRRPSRRRPARPSTSRRSGSPMLRACCFATALASYSPQSPAARRRWSATAFCLSTSSRTTCHRCGCSASA